MNHEQNRESEAVGGAQLPDRQFEQALDLLCASLAENPRQILFPRDELRPWLMARLTGAEAIARSREEAGEPPPIESKKESFRWLLTEGWHQEVKPRWWQMR